MTSAIVILARILSIGMYFAYLLVKVASKREPSNSLEWPSVSDLFKAKAKAEAIKAAKADPTERSKNK